MAEPIEPQDDSQAEPTEPIESDITGTESDGDGEIDHPGDADADTGFSFEQRRFLWTLAGLNVVAVLLGAAIIVGYLASARSSDAAVVRYEDQYNTATDDFHAQERRDIPRIVDAEMRGDKGASDEYGQEMLQAYQTLRTALSDWRRARGLDPREVTNDQLMTFGANLNQQVARDVAAARASTQPATRPAKPFGALP